MRTTAVVMLLSVIAGCSGEGTDAGFRPASDALAAHGVAEYRAQTSASGQDVLLRDADHQTIGELALVQSDVSTTVTLQFRDDRWTQVVAAASGKMTLSLDGRQATLTWDGKASAWSGDAAAEALLADSQPYADFVRLVGGEAQLGMSVSSAPSPSPTTTPPTPTPAADMGNRPPPTLCCSDVVTSGSGWAWYWDEHPEVMACKRANDALAASCAVSSGYDCCNKRANGCTSCIDWGTGFACSTTGYLQYAVDSSQSCK